MILVVAQLRDGQLHRATWESVTAAQLVAGDEPIAVAVLGADLGQAVDAMNADVTELLVGEHPALEPYTPDAWTMALASLIAATAPSLVLTPHTYQARDLFPQLAARLRLPLVTDVTGVRRGPEGFLFTRPMFQGRLAAEVRPRGGVPAIATLQLGAFRADAARTGGAPVRRAIALEVDQAAIRQVPEPPFREAKQAVDLSQAERIVSVGRGIGSQERLPVAERLATALGAELAASRPICDSGWLPMTRQVGSSGQTVAPRLYVALGISGAIQHLVGMKGSRTIVAVNKDADAPIFEVADYGIVGDLFEIVPAIAAELEKS